jgi:hypothetical protein
MLPLPSATQNHHERPVVPCLYREPEFFLTGQNEARLACIPRRFKIVYLYKFFPPAPSNFDNNELWSMPIHLGI